ncbi:hypothetical protein OBV_07590 [Oscillibacter valericigenes Sjm18-20]|nr:hypothetical protein OBV_07590 [Oscillibacter valericigenes Sjm18-20]
MDRMIVAFPNMEAQRRIVKLLETGGYAPAFCCAAGAEAVRATRKLGSAVIVCAFHLRDMTANDLASSLRDTAALLVVSTAANLDFCEGENLFKLSSPTRRADFFASLDLLRRFESKNLRHPAPPRQEEEQRLIRRAKELMMDINRMTEAEAHRFLQKQSMDTGLKLTETARIIVDSYTRGAV